MSSSAGIPKDAEVICLDSSSDEEEDHGSSGKIRSSGTLQQNRRAESTAISNRTINNNNDKNNDVICLLDSDDSDDEVLIVEPPVVAEHPTKQPKPARAAPNQRPSTKSTRRKINVTQDDDDNSDDDDDFLLQCKPSGLGRKAPPKGSSGKASLSSQAPVGTPLGGNAVAAALSKNPSSTANSTGGKPENPAAFSKTPSSSANSTGGKPENPYLKKKTPSSNSSSLSSSDQKQPASTTAQTPSVAAAAAAGSARKRVQTPVTNPYAKKTPSSSKSASTPSSASPGVFYPQLRAGHKLYSDIRPNLVLALWKFSRSRLVQDSYNQAKLDKYITRLVDLAVTNRDFPIRTMGEYAFRQRSPATTGAGIMERDKYERFREDMESAPQMTASIPIDASGTSRQYFTIAEACLVAMKEENVSRWKRNQREGRGGHHDNSQPPLLFPTQPEEQSKILSQKEYWMSLEELIPKIDARLRPECPGRLKRDKDADNGASHYLKPSTRSAEYKQIEKLTKTQAQIENGAMAGPDMGYLKSHSLSKQRYFELTALGYSKAQTLRTRTFPAAVGHYRCSNLDRVDPKYDKICLAVDNREGGGQIGKKVLHEMCNVLDKVSIPYFVGHLSIGDYCFFSGNLLCPLLVERKSVQDLAQSIHEGRMFRQKRRMYQGQFVFGYDNCRIAFIIEGKLEKQQVTGGFVGAARFGVTKERFEEEMKILEAEGFDVLRTTRAENSMFELNRWAQRVAKEVQSGELKLQYTYNEFIDMVKKIPDQTDFSRMAKYHASEKKKAAVERQRDENTISLLDSDDEDTGVGRSREDAGLKGLKPSNLDTKFAKKRKRPLVQTNNGQQKAAAKRSKSEEEKKPEDEYRSLSVSQLKEKCVEFGLTKSGKKDELIDRLLKPRPPDVYWKRKKLGLYVPARLATSSTALLVAVQIYQDLALTGHNYLGRTKEEIYVLAEGLDIKKDPFSGGTTQTGPYHYDGWASMSKLLEPGDPPLVIKKRVKSKDHFRLSTSSDVAGIALARAMHRWCHQSNICRCEELGYTYNL